MFLSPFFLIAAGLGAAVPLFLHLLHNQRKVQLPFPTLRFLKMADKQSSRRIRLENFLLWLIRTLIMAFLGLAFSMPMLRSSGLGWLGDAPRDVAIVIDASYSMGYQTGRGATTWQKGIEAATSIIEGLHEKDRFCIFLAREQPEAVIAEPISKKPEGIRRLKALQPGTTSSRLAPAVNAAVKALRKADPNREQEIHIIADHQALPWGSFSAESGVSEWNPADVNAKLGLFVSLLGVAKPENTGIASMTLSPPVVRKGSGFKVTANALRTGEPTETTAILYIDGKETSRRSFKTGDAASAPVFNVPSLSVGLHVGRVETPDDNLPLDNAFHFLVRVQEVMPTLVVGSPEDTLFIRTALKTGLNRPEALQVIPPEKLSEQKLSGYAGVFLCNALPLSGQALGAVESYVRAGGLLVIFPGMKANAEAYTAWSCLPGTPAKVETLPLSETKRTLTWDKPQHPLIRPVREGTAIPNLAVRRSFTWAKIHETSVRLVSMGSDQPFLLEREFGNGRVLMFAVAADRSWSDFPLSPFYLPFVLQCTEYGEGIGAKEPFVWATDSLSLTERFADLKENPSLSDPDSKPVPIRSAAVEGRTVLMAENLRQPGIYTMASGSGQEPKPALAVNIPREESDLRTIGGKEEVAKKLGIERVHVANDLDGLRKIIEEYRMGRTYGEHLLWLALALIAFEFFYANKLLHRSSNRTMQVAIDIGGHVTTSE